MNPSTPSSRSGRTPAVVHLNAIGRCLTGIRRDLPHLIQLGERMADCLVRGGAIRVPHVSPYWVSEYSCRAGGLMGLGGHGAASRKDVAFFALPDARRWDPRQDRAMQKLLAGRSRLFVIGRREDLAALGSLDRFEGFTGGADPGQGRYRLDTFDPLVSFRPFEELVRAWVTTGEMITSCIRRGKMPIIWMSVWLEGSMVRNAHFHEHNNLREPWRHPLFHKDFYVPPLEPGYAGNTFLAFAEGVRRRLLEQADLLAKAGGMLAEAKRAKKRTYAVIVGHSYPAILNIPPNAPYPIEWGPWLSDLRSALPRDFKPGDTAIHLGYAPTKPGNVAYWLKRGVRLIHSSPYGRPAGLEDHENLVWFDLPWRPSDATVDVPGYSVRILPGSSTAQTMAYFAILSEMAEEMGWH